MYKYRPFYLANSNVINVFRKEVRLSRPNFHKW